MASRRPLDAERVAHGGVILHGEHERRGRSCGGRRGGARPIRTCRFAGVVPDEPRLPRNSGLPRGSGRRSARLNTSWTSVGPPLPIFAPSVGDIAFPSNMAAWIPCRAVGMDVIVHQVFVSCASTVLNVPCPLRSPPITNTSSPNTTVAPPARNVGSGAKSSIDPWRSHTHRSPDGRPTSSVSPR